MQFVVNGSDLDTRNYIINRMASTAIEYDITYENLKVPSLSYYFNLAYSRKTFADPKTIVSMVGDDMEIKTHGWEKRIIDVVNKYDGIGIFYCAGDDRFWDSLCVNLFTTRKYIAHTGKKFMCDAFYANGIDMVHQLSADAANTDVFIEDVIIKHNQWSREEIGQDKTSERLRPMRLKANRDKPKELRYANEIVTSLIATGIAPKGSRAIPTIQDDRPGRKRESVLPLESCTCPVERIWKGPIKYKQVDINCPIHKDFYA